MHLCRFQTTDETIRVGLIASIESQQALDLSAAGIDEMQPLLESRDLIAELQRLARESLPRQPLAKIRLLAPVERQEVWAAGVTYQRSRQARMDESEHSASAYDLVYEAARPELFFKSLPEKVAGPGQPVGIRRDAHWNVPEPELALVFNSRRSIAGYGIGNDMSSRDIEGENLLYLPQAKIYHRSCALGPWIRVGTSETEARSWTINLSIHRAGREIFHGQTETQKIKRPFAELGDYLFRSQTFQHGVILLTGTGIVPGDDFTLQPNDLVRINISGIGALSNPVIAV